MPATHRLRRHCSLCQYAIAIGRSRREPNELDRLVTHCVSQIESHGPPAKIHWSVTPSVGKWPGPWPGRWQPRGIGLVYWDLLTCLPAQRLSRARNPPLDAWAGLSEASGAARLATSLARSPAGLLFRSRTGWSRTTFRRLHGFGLLPRMLKSRRRQCTDAVPSIYSVRECVARMATLASGFITQPYCSGVRPAFGRGRRSGVGPLPGEFACRAYLGQP